MDESAQTGHELDDIHPAKIILFGAVLLVVLAAAAAVGFLFLKYEAVRYPAPQIAPAPPRVREPAPAPRLQVQGSKELREMREAEERVLHGYAWVDREKGIVMIPIEKAMELLAEREGGKRQAIGGSRKQRGTQ